MDDHELLKGQMNIYEVISDFEKDKKTKVKKELKVKNSIPVAIKTEEWLLRKGK